MKLIGVCTSALFAGLFLAPPVSLACSSVGWAVPEIAQSTISVDQAIEAAKTTANVIVKKSAAQYRCGSDSNYDVIDATSGDLLGVIPVPAETRPESSATLTARVAQLLSTPREQLIALKNTEAVFYEDVRGLEADLAVGAYVPNALPFATRTRNAGQDYLVYVYIQSFCERKYFEHSPHNLAEVYINTTEYIPGRTNYSPATIYQKGDLKKAVLSEQGLLTKLRGSVETNIQYCRPNTMNDVSWYTVLKRLDAPDLTATERFLSVKERAISASMITGHRILVIFENSQQEFGGPVSDMLQIQAQLAARGVDVDKRGKLNYEGKIELEVGLEEGRTVPASLQ